MARLTIRWEAGAGMVRVVGLVVITRVATKTGVWCIVVISVMAGITVIGNSRVCADNRIETIVIKGRRNPGVFRMATLAIRRELRRRVVWIRRLIVGRSVTTKAGIRRIVVISVVAGHTLIGNDGVCPVQLVIIVVNVK